MSRLILILIAAVACAPTGVACAAEQLQPSTTESIGTALLEDLAPLLNESSVPAAGKMPSEVQRDVQPNNEVRAASGPSVLVRVQREMHRAESLIKGQLSLADRQQEQASDVQEQILQQLDELIAQLSKQCQGGECPPSDSPPKPERSAGKPKPANASAARGTTAARDSNSQLRPGAEAKLGETEIQELGSKFWGHLPERDRQQMLQSFSEEFLPEYEAEIQQYYRSLSEDESIAPPSSNRN